MMEPLFDPAEIERERKVVIEEMNILRDDPAGYVHDLIPELLWPNDPLGREVIGSMEVIKSLSRQSIVDYQAKHYTADNMVVAVAGNIKHQRVVDSVETLFGQMPGASRNELAPLQEELSSALVRPFAKQTNQAHLVIGTHGYPFGHRLDMAATVLSNLLGVGASSRLFINVRGERGLAYHVNADYSNFTDTGLFEIYAGVNLDKINLAMQAILEEIARVKSEPVSDEELVGVKNKMSGALAMSLENSFTVADRFGSRLLLTDRIKTVEEIMEEIEAVTPDDIMKVAQEMLKPDKLRMAIIAPEPQPAAEMFEKLVKG
jgi:predicted Zn-dependent peptidase